MLSMKHSWNERDRLWGTGLRGAQSHMEPWPYLSLYSLRQGLHGGLQLVLQLEHVHQPGGNTAQGQSLPNNEES
jgi:hypothetical protein